MSTAFRSQTLHAPRRAPGVPRWQLAELLHEDHWTQTFAARAAESDAGTDFLIKLARQELPTEYDRQLAQGLLQREAKVSRLVRHRRLATTLEVLRLGSEVWLLQPQLTGAPLSAVKDVPLSQKLWATRQIAQALEALHDAGWLHGSVSAEAIFVASSGQATLGSLGWCRQLECDECDLAKTAFAGDIRHAAPEMLDALGRLTPAADVYSLGVLLFELLTGFTPFAEFAGPELAAAKRLLPTPQFDAGVNLPFELRSLTARMLSRDPLRRPSVAEVIQTLIAVEIASFS